MLVFGTAKFQNGILVEPTAEAQIDPTDAKALSGFRNAIWYDFTPWVGAIYYMKNLVFVVDRALVERANASAPSHSRIFKEASRSIITVSRSVTIDLTFMFAPPR